MSSKDEVGEVAQDELEEVAQDELQEVDESPRKKAKVFIWMFLVVSSVFACFQMKNICAVGRQEDSQLLHEGEGPPRHGGGY